MKFHSSFQLFYFFLVLGCLLSACSSSESRFNIPGTHEGYSFIEENAIVTIGHEQMPRTNFCIDLKLRSSESIKVFKDQEERPNFESGQNFILFPRASDSLATFALSVGSNGLNVFEIRGIDTILQISHTSDFNEYKHIELCYVDQLMKLFIDGALVDSNSSGQGGLVCNVNLGQQVSPSDLFDGSIFSFKIWEGVFTNEEIASWVDQPFTGEEKDLFLYYNFRNHRKNRIIYDNSGQNRYGVIKVFPELISSTYDRNIFKGSMRFDGEIDGVVFDQSSLPYSNFTYEFWFRDKREEIEKVQLQYLIFPAHGGESGLRGTGVFLKGDTLGVIEHKHKYLEARIDSAVELMDWNHVAVVYQENAPSLYLNGNLIGQAAADSDSIMPNFQIGHQIDEDIKFESEIDEFRFWSRPLTSSEINHNMGVSLFGREPDLEVYFDFNGANDSLVVDKTRSELHGVVVQKQEE